MRESYYIRVRGRVQGPVVLENLKALAARGELSRAHELSPDGKSWMTAACLPELFQRPHVSRSDEGSPPSSVSPHDEDKPSKQWHYMAGSTPLGPVSDNDIADLIRHQSLMRESLVWREGMKQWVPVSFVPEFVGCFGAVLSSSPSLTAGLDIPGATTKTTRKSKTKAIILALFLGGFGIHHFYLGNTTRGIVNIVLTLLFLGSGAILALVEAILVTTTSEEQFELKWCNLGNRMS